MNNFSNISKTTGISDVSPSDKCPTLSRSGYVRIVLYYIIFQQTKSYDFLFILWVDVDKMLFFIMFFIHK